MLRPELSSAVASPPAQGPPASVSSVLGLQAAHHAYLPFYVDAENQNSNTHVCTASVLSTKPKPPTTAIF